MSQRKIELHVQTLDNILDLQQSDFSDFRSFNDYKKQQIKQFRNQLLSQHLGCDLSDLDFAKLEHGKPYLTSHMLNFNHSHSKKSYVLGLSDQILDIGVDLEELERKVRFDAFAKHAFHPKEYEIWQQLDEDREYWFKVWTTKEAVLKASGLGICLDLNTLNTNVHPEQQGGMCSHPLIGTFGYQNFSLNQKIILTIAWRAELSCRGFQFPDIQVIQHD